MPINTMNNRRLRNMIRASQVNINRGKSIKIHIGNACKSRKIVTNCISQELCMYLNLESKPILRKRDK